MSDLIPPTKSLETQHRYQNLRIKFDAKLLRIMAPFIAKQDIRYYLNGLRIERATDKDKGIYLVATNGHMMAVYYDADGHIVGDNDRGVIMSLHPAMLANAGRATTRFGAKPLQVIASGLRVSLAPDFGFEHTAAEVFIQPGMPWVEGNYPDWRKVLPEFEKLQPVVSGAWNMRYLAEFAKVTTDKRYGTVRLWQSTDPGNNYANTPAMIIQLTERPTFVGIMMPVYSNADKDLMRPVFDAKPRPATEPKPDALREKLRDEYSSGLDSPPGG